MLRVALPRASSQAYRQFKQQHEEEGQELQANGAEAEAQQQPEQAAPPQEAAADGQAGGQAAQLAAALNDIKARDSGGVLEAGPGGTSLRWVGGGSSPLDACYGSLDWTRACCVM